MPIPNNPRALEASRLRGTGALDRTVPVAAASLSKVAALLTPGSWLEWLWWLGFCIWAFLPGHFVTVVAIGALDITMTDLLLASLGLIALPVAFMYRGRYPYAFRWGLMPLLLLGLYAVASLLCQGAHRRHDFWDLIFPAVQMTFAACVGFSVIATLPKQQLNRIGWRLASILILVALIYAAVSLFQFGTLREAESVNPLLGIRRVAGPLAGPTILPSLLLVSLSYFGSQIGITPGFWIKSLACCALAAGILLCGSRSGVIALMVLLLFLLRRTRKVKYGALIAASVVLGVVLFGSLAKFDRFRSIEDRQREIIYKTAIGAWTASKSAVVFGQGYGQVWPWYGRHIDALETGKGRYFVVPYKTDFGVTMLHAHSIYFALLGELGLVGFVLFAVTIASQVLPSLGKAYRARLAGFLGPGIAASLVIGAFSLLLLSTFTAAAVWWVFFFAMAADRELAARARPLPLRT